MKEKINKLICLLVFFSACNTTMRSQSIIYKDSKRKAADVSVGISLLQKISKDSVPFKDIEPLLDTLLSQNWADSVEIKDGKKLERSAVAVLVYHPFDASNHEDTTRISMFAFRENRTCGKYPIAKYGKYEPVDSIYDKKKIVFILVGDMVNSKKFSAKKGKSFFENNLKEFFTAATGLIPGIKSKDTTTTEEKMNGPVIVLPIRYVRLDRKKLHSPCDISFYTPVQEKIKDDTFHTTSMTVTVKEDQAEVSFKVRPEDFRETKSDTTVYYYSVAYSITDKANPSIKDNDLVHKTIYIPRKEFYRDTVSKQTISIHDKNYFAFSMGITTKNIKPKYFSYVNDSFSVSLDSTGKEDWKAAVYASLAFYPFGRKIDNYGWFWQNPWNRFGERFGLYGGLQFSKQPFDHIYTGITFALAKYANLDFGLTFDKELTVQTKYLPGVVDLKNVRDNLDRKYTEKFYIGISFSPLILAKALGVGGGK